MEQAELIQTNIKKHIWTCKDGFSTSTGAEHRSGATEHRSRNVYQDTLCTHSALYIYIYIDIFCGWYGGKTQWGTLNHNPKP